MFQWILNRWMTKHKITIKQFAKLSGYGYPTVRRWKNEGHLPHWHNLHNIIDTFTLLCGWEDHVKQENYAVLVAARDYDWAMRNAK
jgi:hypothetical protein